MSKQSVVLQSETFRYGWCATDSRPIPARIELPPAATSAGRAQRSRASPGLAGLGMSEPCRSPRTSSTQQAQVAEQLAFPAHNLLFAAN